MQSKHLRNQCLLFVVVDDVGGEGAALLIGPLRVETLPGSGFGDTIALKDALEA